MIDLHRVCAALGLGFVVATVATDGLARERWRDFSRNEGSAAREAAIQTCSARASRYWQYAWGNWGSYIYRACMAEQKQVE